MTNITPAKHPRTHSYVQCDGGGARQPENQRSLLLYERLHAARSGHFPTHAEPLVAASTAAATLNPTIRGVGDAADGSRWLPSCYCCSAKFLPRGGSASSRTDAHLSFFSPWLRLFITVTGIKPRALPMRPSAAPSTQATSVLLLWPARQRGRLLQLFCDSSSILLVVVLVVFFNRARFVPSLPLDYVRTRSV